MTAPARMSWTDVRDTIHARILDGTHRPGDKLPRDEDIAAEFGCARTTVHRAMQALAEAGVVERRRKGGTTVRTDPVARATLDIPITRLEVEARGARYGYQLIDLARAAAPPTVTAACELPAPHEMLRIRALHLADARPYIFEDRWIDLETVPEIERVDLTAVSANEWLVLNRPHSRFTLGIFARGASAEDARMMEVDDGTALLILERTTWIADAPITFVRATTAPGYRLSADV